MKNLSSELKHSEEMYAQLIALYPSNQRFLRKYTEMLEKLQQPIQTEKVYKKLQGNSLGRC